MPTAAVILAAGGASRFIAADPDAAPGAKLLSVVKGRPLLAWAIAPALEAGLDEVIVVSGAADLRGVVPATVTLVHNDDWADGQATSLRVGLEWCGPAATRAAVIGLGDQPGLTRGGLAGGRGLHPTGRSSSPPTTGVAGTRYASTPQSGRCCRPTGDEGARSLARRRPELVTELACAGVPADIDTPEDLQRWRDTWN